MGSCDTAREDILCHNSQPSSKQACLTDESDSCHSDNGSSDQGNKQSIRSAAEALKFPRDELSLAISKVNYLLHEIKIQGRKQSRIDDHLFVEKQ